MKKKNEGFQYFNYEFRYVEKYRLYVILFYSRHHILQFGPMIQEGNEHLVHHMEVFHCAGPADRSIPAYTGPCQGPDRPKETQVKRESWISEKET